MNRPIVSKVLAVLASVAFLATSSLGAELITKSRAVKGYGKRDRVFPVSSQTVSPSQLHEVYGPRVDAGLDITRADSKINNVKASTTAPTATVRGVVAGDILALGLAASRGESSGRENTEIATKERVIGKKVVPSVAATIADHVTIGASSELNWMELRQNSDYARERTYDGFARREAIGLSVHTSKMEVGMMHATLSRNRIHTDNFEAGGAQQAFLLTSISDDTMREIYVPASNTVFARGNLTPNWSVQGAVSHTEYDSNAQGAKETFNDYNRADRLSGQLQAIYWLNDEATRFAATANYRGATYAPFGSEENGLGYRHANLYGGSIDAIVDIGSQSYVGVRLSHLRGERDQQLTGFRLAAREARTNIGTTVSKSF
jgi:hypothetical protein